MAPKPTKSPKPAARNYPEDWQQELIDKIADLSEKFDNLEASLRAVTAERNELKSKLELQATEIADLRNNLNEREQYARSWSMRCLNIPIPANSESDTRAVMQSVYDSLLHPILEGARRAGHIQSVPDCESLLETAHILPGKAGAKPVICRFFSRYWRNLVFRNRKEFAPRESTTSASSTRASQGKATRMSYPFFEDLTRATFMKLTTIKQREEVTSAWTVNGSIRFKTKNNETVYKVNSINETYKDIVS